MNMQSLGGPFCSGVTCPYIPTPLSGLTVPLLSARSASLDFRQWLSCLDTCSHLFLEALSTFLLLMNTCLPFRAPLEWTLPRASSLHLRAESSLLEGFAALGFSSPVLSRGANSPETTERLHRGLRSETPLIPAVSHPAVAWEPLSENQFSIVSNKCAQSQSTEHQFNKRPIHQMGY